MGKQYKDSDDEIPSRPRRSTRKIPQVYTFQQFARLRILKRKTKQRSLFERQAYVCEKIEEISLYIHEGMKKEAQLQNVSIMEARIDSVKLKQAISRLSCLRRELAVIKHNLKDFYDQTIDEYIF